MKLPIGKLIKSTVKAVGPLVIAAVSAKAHSAIEKKAGELAKKVGKKL